MKALSLNRAGQKNSTINKEGDIMGKGVKIIAMLLVVAILAVSNIAAAGELAMVSHDPIGNMQSLSHFSALDGIQAEPMNSSEMDKVVGKATPVPIPRFANFYYAMLWAYFMYQANLVSINTNPVNLVAATPIALP